MNRGSNSHGRRKFRRRYGVDVIATAPKWCKSCKRTRPASEVKCPVCGRGEAE